MNNLIYNSNFDPNKYKNNTKNFWNTISLMYHKKWVSEYEGPFKSTVELVKSAHINSDDKVLDLACGTGAVSKEVIKLMNNINFNNIGYVIGIDISRNALLLSKASHHHIAKQPILIEMDAENLGFCHSSFDKVLCQFGLMFFPNPLLVLKSIKEVLVRNGKLAITVHGTSESVPYFSCIMNSILKYMPNLISKGPVSVFAFGNRDTLFNIIEEAGFTDIKIEKFTYNYTAGFFEDYWSEFMTCTANFIYPMINAEGPEMLSNIREETKRSIYAYTNSKGIINFPWEILIATAFKNKY